LLSEGAEASVERFTTNEIECLNVPKYNKKLNRLISESHNKQMKIDVTGGFGSSIRGKQTELRRSNTVPERGSYKYKMKQVPNVNKTRWKPHQKSDRVEC